MSLGIAGSALSYDMQALFHVAKSFFAVRVLAS